MESTCKVFLAPRARNGEPDVVITRQPSGLLLAAVSCTCPRDEDCKTHTTDELLKRALAHHERTAPLFPCKFTMSPRGTEYTRPLMGCTVLTNPIPAQSPYGPPTAQSTIAADPTSVTQGKLGSLQYMPPHSMPGLVFCKKVTVNWPAGFD